MTADPAPAQDNHYRAWADQLAERAAVLPSDVVDERVEQAFRDLCAEVAPTLSLEVGAHEATFSRWFKGRFPAARAVAFEANPYVHRKFVEPATAAGVEYLHLAVSPTAGSVELGIPREFHNEETDRRFTKRRSNRMASLANHRYAEKVEKVAVPSLPLDDAADLSDDDVVVAWVDVEGASGPVLSSGARLLSRASLVYIEVEKEQVWDGQWLDVDVARHLAGCGLVPVLRDIQRPHQYNVIFASADLADAPATTRLREAVFRPVDA